jgi:endonuclease/exonuclease/phosphatase family metal-dependent hydrolase
MTLNLWAQHGEWAKRRRVLQDGMRSIAPDVLTLQETVVDDDYDQVVDVLGDGYNVVHQTMGLVGDGRHHGVSIATKWPISAVHEVDLHLTPRTRSYSCGGLVAELDAPPPLGRLLVANHGASWEWWAETERELQAVAMAGAIERLAHTDLAPVVIGGDFNAERDAASMRFFSGRQALGGTSVAYEDCWSSLHAEGGGWTIDPGNPLRRVNEPHVERGRVSDYLLVRCGVHGPNLLVTNCWLAFTEPVDGVWASDHCGVVADLHALDGSVDSHAQGR